MQHAISTGREFDSQFINTNRVVTFSLLVQCGVSIFNGIKSQLIEYLLGPSSATAPSSDPFPVGGGKPPSWALSSPFPVFPVPAMTVT